MTDSKLFVVVDKVLNGKVQPCVILNSTEGNIVAYDSDRLFLQMIAASLNDALENSIEEIQRNTANCNPDSEWSEYES